MIEFPCPEPIAKMTLSKDKWTCNSCDQELVEVNPFDEKPTGRCVISSQPLQFKYSIKKFALALLLGFGASVFVFENAAFAFEIQEAKVLLLSDSIITTDSLTISVRLKGKNNQHIANGSVIATLPNGKELHFQENFRGDFSLVIPQYCEGKKITITAYMGENTQSKKIKVPIGETIKPLVFKFRKVNFVKSRNPGFL